MTTSPTGGKNDYFFHLGYFGDLVSGNRLFVAGRLMTGPESRTITLTVSPAQMDILKRAINPSYPLMDDMLKKLAVAWRQGEPDSPETIG
mgnify:CR=1 FL=1